MLNKFLMRNYPNQDRNNIIDSRIELSESDRNIARKFDKAYFDSTRNFGYGGYYYDKKFFSKVVKDFIYYYDLKPGDKILDVGCAKGFMLHDFISELPSLNVFGIDISEYAIDNAIDSVKNNLQIACCSDLPFNDKEFDLVISISTIHNLNINGVKKSLSEITRVAKNNKSFIKINGYKNFKEREKLENWNLVAKTILHENEWVELFQDIGYKGDYDFFKC